MKVLITNRIPEEIIKKYEENFEVDYHDSLDFLSKEELKNSQMNILKFIDSFTKLE